VYSVAVDEVQVRFNVSSTTAILPLSLYIYGLAFGPLIAAPLSETYGRRFVYLLTMPFFLAFTVGAGFAPTFSTLLVCRFFAGVMGGPPLALGAGTFVDLWPSLLRGRSTALFVMSPFLGPALGPSVGGFVVLYEDWRWTQWTIVFLGTAVFIFSLGTKETYGKVILRRRAKQLDLPLPPGEVPAGLAGVRFLLTVTITRPVHMLLTEPAVTLYSVYVAFNIAVLNGFFASFPIVYLEVYRFNLWQTGLVFLGLTVGSILGTVIAILVDYHTYAKPLLRANNPRGSLPPEKRLYTAMIGSIMLPAALIWFACSARESVHWIVPEIATVFFACGNLLVFVCVVLSHLLLDVS
jgi:MFS family permease